MYTVPSLSEPLFLVLCALVASDQDSRTMSRAIIKGGGIGVSRMYIRLRFVSNTLQKTAKGAEPWLYTYTPCFLTAVGIVPCEVGVRWGVGSGECMGVELLLGSQMRLTVSKQQRALNAHRRESARNEKAESCEARGARYGGGTKGVWSLLVRTGRNPGVRVRGPGLIPGFLQTYS